MTWDPTPKLAGMATPTPKKTRSRWDETPASMGSATQLPRATPSAFTPSVTPMGGVDLPTPTAINLRGAITPEQYNLLRWQKEIEERNRPLTEDTEQRVYASGGVDEVDNSWNEKDEYLLTIDIFPPPPLFIIGDLEAEQNAEDRYHDIIEEDTTVEPIDANIHDVDVVENDIIDA